MWTVLVALLLHELGHILGVIFTREGKFLGIHISFKGIGTKWEPLNENYVNRIIITLSGSLMNLLVSIIAFSLGWVTLGWVNIWFGMANLLIPIYPGDGVRAYRMWRDKVCL